ncbi:TonB-dependent receptor [Chitinophaga horti]|uniref:TonB-dependent receptor n=1 Tax=Chitinophaga horti TaxID=2920382 RepID=A0ABY6IYM8_9BACT|nr:TonB-dependent receptor [Chitinophaga horti]UYQ92498.1 TonB-dependent receptor [Chitinophaga horti]
MKKKHLVHAFGPPHVLLKVLVVMKLTFLFILVSFLHLSASVHSQDRVTMDLREADIRKVLMAIEAQTKYHFLFSERKLQPDKKVDLNVKEENVFKVLEAVLPMANLQYKLLDGNLIAITTRGEDNLSKVLRKDVRGIVTDTSGSPLPGVTIAVKEKPSVGTTTDLNGKYVLDIPEGGTALIFSMIGYDKQEISLNGRDVINVQLAPASNQLDETVIVGFGKQKKKEVVGAMTTINPRELKVPSSNLTTALAGRMAGVIAYQRSGEPGADNADFFIRGVTTFGYKKDPLILIDGIELTTTDLARMQVDDIASFSILKDATSTALYGARGANGVILVTTKEGVEGKARVSVRVENSLSAPTENVELADPITYMKLGNEAVVTRDPLGKQLYSEAKIDNTIAGTNPLVYPATDWRRELFKTHTNNQRANLNISGGGKIARYYLAATMNQDNGVLKVDKRNNFNNNINLKTYALRSNVNINLTKSTEIGVRLYGTFDDYTGPLTSGTDMYNRVMYANPVLFPAYYPMDDAHTHTQHIMFGNFGTGNYINPYADMVKGYKEYTRSTIVAQFEAKQDFSFITEGLSVHALFNTTRTSFFDVARFYKPFWYQVQQYDKYADNYTLGIINPNDGTEYLEYDEGNKDIRATTYLQTTANYNRTFRDKHNFSAMLVFLMNNQITANAGSLQLSLPHRNIGLSGRYTYSYDNRYFVEFDFGYNGSERFHKDKRFGFFPSVGGAWIISNEKFLKPYQHILHNLKLRYTYGLVGNDAIGAPEDRFFYLSDVNMNDPGRSSAFGTDYTYSRPGINVNRYGNNNITWETATKTNWGLEIGLNNNLNILLDVYTEYRRNILMTRASIPVTMGVVSSSDVKANIGEASGKGMDLSIDYSHNFSRHLWMQARANFTYSTSKFEVFEEPDYDERYLSMIGQPLSQVRGYIAERLFADDKEVLNSPHQSFGEYMAGDIKYHDVNGDGIISTRDLVPIGYPTTPEIVYGFGFSVGYKSFDLSAFFQGLARESFWINPTTTAPFVNDRALLKAYADDHWSEDNRNLYAIWPRLSNRNINNNQVSSTWFMRNGAFLRLKTAELGYTLPQATTRRIKIEKARFYASGINLFALSRFKLWDVEMGGNGLGYPVQRVINFGTQISF